MLLNYWIYDKLTDTLGTENNSVIDVAFGSLQYIWNYPMGNEKNTNPYKKCKDNFNILTKADWEKRKELYAYYIDYSTIKPMIKFYKSKFKDFYKYIEGKQKLFKYFRDICYPDSTECPDYYIKCKDYNAESVLHTLSCHIHMISTKKCLATQAHSEQGLVCGPRPYCSDLSRHGAASSVLEMTHENSDIGTS
ncbi:PIR Superfamily Protein [Plasmodium ovale curtisi]|uniref:PIR Superfamily Protein n=1 Tax=Plasmodium ovale curtisi TaxID=864141 RepID=A0A1A8XB59_PLAOA|nr:PIR Superfamily Protein [Plasmodium ovale curtisi]